MVNFFLPLSGLGLDRVTVTVPRYPDTNSSFAGGYLRYLCISAWSLPGRVLLHCVLQSSPVQPKLVAASTPSPSSFLTPLGIIVILPEKLVRLLAVVSPRVCRRPEPDIQPPR